MRVLTFRGGAKEQPSHLREHYRRNGFVIVESVLDDDEIRRLSDEAASHVVASSARGGVRNLLHKSSALRAKAEAAPLRSLAAKLLDGNPRPTKLTLFDKTAGANWKIRWHQDLTIAVRERRETPGFTAWSEKEGVPHVRAPAEFLESIVALRLHLDDAPASNGALRVLPGSHLLGRLTRDQIAELRERRQEVVCELRRGDVMAMSPLLLHASSKAKAPTRRRVLHFEYGARALPNRLAWL